MSEKLSKKIKSDLYYDYLIKDILNNDHYQLIKDISHHGSTDRYSHCLSVSYRAYKIAKIFGGDLRIIARSGLLHDFYYEKTSDFSSKLSKIKLLIRQHPSLAVINAKKEFNINDREENAIISHMYPVNFCLPRYKESWIVAIADKIVSFGEVGHRFKYSFNMIVLFIVNQIFK